MSDPPSGFEFDPFDAQTIEDPYPKYRILRDQIPVYHNPRRGFWAISRAQDVHDLMRDWESCTSSLGMDLDDTGLMFGPGNFLNIDPPEHDVLRKVARGSFSARRISSLEPVIRHKVTELMDRFLERGHADIAAELTHPLPFSIVSSILGVPESDHERTSELVHTILHRRPGETEPPPEALVASAELAQYIEQLSADRRRNPREDALTDVVTGQIEGRPLPQEMVLGMSLVLYVAGSEPVSNFISNSLNLLAQHRDARAELFANTESMMPTAVEELLRFESPLQNMARTTTRPITLHGTEIPAGARLALLLGSANRDERRFDDADRLDLKRPIQRNIAFGEGVHFCLGAPLARLQGKVVLDEVARRMPDYEIGSPLVRLGKVNSRGFESLPITF
jgi:hypothetical protein